MPFLLFALVVTAIVVYLAWRGMNGAGDRPGGSPALRPKPRPTKPLAPDDDPEFLGEIDRRLRGEDKSG